MEIKWMEVDKLLIVKMKEEIDHHVSERIRRKVDYEIQRYLPKKVIFDFSSVNFMDSAGIGMIIGRYKLISMFGATMEICNVCIQVQKILQMSGVTKLIKIHTEEEEFKYA